MTPVRLDDDRTLVAIGIMADVLDRPRGQAKLECMMTAKALRQVLETRSQSAFDFAVRAFQRIDPGIRREIAGEATTVARRIRGQPSGPRPVGAGADMGGLLDAINTRGLRPAPPVPTSGRRSQS